MPPGHYSRLDTTLHTIMAVLKQAAPRPVWEGTRRLGTALLTPLAFGLVSGHFRSALAGRALTARGDPLPWYTYPAIAALAGTEYDGRRVLEFGAGQSTLWWAARAAEVISLEENASWYRALARCAPANVRLHLVPANLGEAAEQAIGPGVFDVIVVDGCNRLAAMRLAATKVAAGGAVVLDNAEGSWGAESTYPALSLMRDAGFERVDFIGYAPGLIRQHCTSIFFRGSCFLFTGKQPPDLRASAAFERHRPNH